MSTRQHTPGQPETPTTSASHGACGGACVPRRDLAALSLAGAAAVALAGCGPDRGGLQPDEVQAGEAGTVSLAELPEHSTTIVNFGGQRAFVAVVRGEGDDLHGFEAYCTHQGCALTPQGPVLHCPCHNSTFDAESGDVKGGPAETPLVPVALTLAGDQVSRA